MTTLMLIALCLATFVFGFFTGAALLAVTAMHHVENRGRFDAGPVSFIGRVERRHGR